MAYLDSHGLSTLWTKLKNTFVLQVTGKQLSTEDYTSAEKTKLSGIETGADVTDATNVASAGAEMTANKVTSVSSSSTDTQYPSAKCLYDTVGNIETLLETLL